MVFTGIVKNMVLDGLLEGSIHVAVLKMRKRKALVLPMCMTCTVHHKQQSIDYSSVWWCVQPEGVSVITHQPSPASPKRSRLMVSGRSGPRPTAPVTYIHTHVEVTAEA